ncbi:unnamed protein product, partial [Laminaria digitata]
APLGHVDTACQGEEEPEETVTHIDADLQHQLLKVSMMSTMVFDKRLDLVNGAVNDAVNGGVKDAVKDGVNDAVKDGVNGVVKDVVAPTLLAPGNRMGNRVVRRSIKKRVELLE